MAPRNQPDGPHGSAAALNPERSDDEVFLDRFADNPLGGTKLYEFFLSWPANDYFPSRQEVERIAQHQVDTIFGAFDRIRFILERHEDTIRKRWTKKSTSKKKKLLLAAQPNIPDEHRPDIAIEHAVQSAYREKRQLKNYMARLAMARNSEACMVPYLNMEDLLQSGTFLTLLNSRGRNPVESFTQTELLHAPIARWSDATIQLYLRTYTMLFARRDTQTTYGQLKHWRSESDARQSVYEGGSVHLGHGLQILGIQKILYTFLQRCCFLLVGDLLSNEKAQLNGYPIIQQPSSLFTGTTEYTNRAEVSLMAPYTVPNQLDFGRLRILVSAKVGEIEDHIWALREDPGYFCEVFDDNKTHRMEYLKSTDGNVNAILKEPPHAMLGAIIRNLIMDAYLTLYYWHECLRLVKQLQFTTARTDFMPSLDQDLPAEHHRNFLRLWTMLLALHTDIHECFRQRVPGTPAMRRYFVKTYADPNSGYCNFEIDPSKANGDATTTRFLAALSRIWRPKAPPKVGFIAELDEIERMVLKEPSVKTLLSPYVWSDFSQLSVSSECIQQIRSYQPWATRIEQDVDLLKPELMMEFLKFGVKWDPVLRKSRFESPALARLADPSGGKFHYPVTDKPSRKKTDALRLAEENLDAFWEAADAFCKKLTGASFPGLLAHDLTHGRALRRTAPWTEPLPRGQKDIPHEHVTDRLLPDTFRVPNTTSGEQNVSLPLVKEKVKTRGTENSISFAGAHHQPTNKVIDSPKPMVTVDKRSYTVFKALFFSPFARDVPGEVSWKDFVHAMVQRGFEAEKLHGSSWRFTPTTLNAERAIQFHAPHGALSKLPLTWARRYGRRLEREYGWTGEMFTLA
ncbi:hypothetical protein J4E89_009749 [Alternaria sp. Ai002NY15]|nr:hypothetical protein J4E89_009749 [Alternaria sp. Ai002NY15]